MRPLDQIPSALEHFDEIAARMQGMRLAVFLDCDGVLAPIVARPELAAVSDEMRATVAALADRCTVAVISGRDRADVARIVGLDDLVYAGSHGFDIGGPDGMKIEHDAGGSFVPVMVELADRVEDRIGEVEGSLVERKKYSIAVHYRLVDPALVPSIEAAIDEVLGDEAFAGIRKTHGKMVFDLQPALDWNKGKAVEWVMHALDRDHDDVLPVFVGDDLTDEDAFAALEGRGLGIVVVSDSERDSRADYAVPEVPDVAALLGRFADELADGPAA